MWVRIKENIATIYGEGEGEIVHRVVRDNSHRMSALGIVKERKLVKVQEGKEIIHDVSKMLNYSEAQQRGGMIDERRLKK